MVDLNTRTIQNLFEQQIRALTQRTIMAKEDSFDCFQRGNTKNPTALRNNIVDSAGCHDWIFDFQLSGAWLR